MFFITAHLGQPHGSAKSAADFARALLANCRDVSMVSPRLEDFGPTAADRQLGHPHWYLIKRRSAQRRRISTISDALDMIRDWVIRHRLGLAMDGKLVVVNGWGSYAYWKELAMANYRQSAIIIRESPRHFLYSDRPNSFETMLAGFSEFDRLIFVSDRLRAEWTQFDELACKPTYYLPNCCEEEEVAVVRRTDRRQLRHRLELQDEDFVVLCPGTIELRKGQDIALDALPEMTSKIPHVRLVILGDAGTAWGHAMVEKIKTGGYGKRVVHIPTKPSALEYLYAADVLLVPSRAEAMPRTVLEGMALGTPIVATSVDGIPELIEDGVSGWLFNPDDPTRMLAGLASVAAAKGAAGSLASTAERRYKEMFSRRRQIERVACLLEWIETDQLPL